MRTVPLPPGVKPIAIDKYIILWIGKPDIKRLKNYERLRQMWLGNISGYFIMGEIMTQ